MKKVVLLFRLTVYLPVGIVNRMEHETSTRHTILVKALDLFSLKGYESASVQEICDQSGITKPTLYHHFGSKRGVLDAIIGEYGGAMFSIIERESSYNHDLVMNLKALTRSLIGFALSNQSFYRLYITLSAAAPETQGYAAYQSLRTGIDGCIESMFRKAAEDHGNMRGREKAYSETFQGVVRTWTMLVLNKETQLTDDTLHAIVHYYMHGIFS
ncbi:MAG: Biofilm operon icaADBC HTH-type negative transcriptional regulator IcaR [Spirochaetes bacterium ADurb.Bin269]|nr:MAG: Biofilm operon icaADBC HTH-type negative transcriptional regulator IcaR [Spirochaetes bacterium ADurb.Bin269]